MWFLLACSEPTVHKADPDTADATSGTDSSTPPDTATTPDTACVPATCTSAGATCGTLDDGCGATLDCGGCAAWFGCEATACQPMACIPSEEATTDGGGRCEDLAQAWTARGINVGYYPFRAIAPIDQYSGDCSGPAGVTFTRGTTTAGVILQTVPVGSYVALSSTGPWYDPTGECFPDGTCGSESVEACGSSAPPLRPGNVGFYWGYAYSGASHMQGWFYVDAEHLEFAGWDPAHPCATGPASADFEVDVACGVATACAGTNRTCGDANGCTEGSDDCGSENCGAESGGALTPSAHRSTVSYPPDAVPCTELTPPDPSIQCLPNGTDVDFFLVYPHGAYLYWAQNSTTKAWIHYGDSVQSYFHTRDAQGVLWDFVEVLTSGATILTPASDGSGGGCTSTTPEDCTPCRNGGTCGWVQATFLD